MRVLGISAYYHDSAAALIIDGKVVAAAQEERFTRIRHDAAFPTSAIQYCLDTSQTDPAEIDYVVFYEDFALKSSRVFETVVASAPVGFGKLRRLLTNSQSLTNNGFQRFIQDLQNAVCVDKIDLRKVVTSDHHLSHAAAAFYPSPFEEAAILVMDGVGEWLTTTISVGDKNSINLLKQINYPHSIGLLYSAFTAYCGFRVNSGEYKLMGLAPYGVPRYSNIIMSNIIDVREDGSFAVDTSYFDYMLGEQMLSGKFEDLFGAPTRSPESPILQRHMDIAASIQMVVEEIVLKLCNHAKYVSGMRNLCLGGGVALNCVANGKILKSRIFDSIWIQPAAGDAGSALGAALSIYYKKSGLSRLISLPDGMNGGYLGPEFEARDIRKALEEIGADFQELEDAALFPEVARILADGNAIGWMSGRMEFGPRALGNRSILADPRSAATQKLLNLKVKYRESFRPFAPSVIAEDSSKWFDLDCESPYMLLVGSVKEAKRRVLPEGEDALFGMDKLEVVRSEIPAVTHVDYSSRIQTVRSETNSRFYRLLSEFNKLTNCPILVNTSFNIRGEPIVCTPTDAYRCFMGTEIDYLIIENFVLDKKRQKLEGKSDYRSNFALD